jgi:hypothetical protein
MQAFKSSRVRSGKSPFNFCFGHLGSQVLKHFINRNLQAAYTRLTTAFIGFDRDVVSVVHSWNHCHYVLDLCKILAYGWGSSKAVSYLER